MHGSSAPLTGDGVTITVSGNGVISIPAGAITAALVAANVATQAELDAAIASLAAHAATDKSAAHPGTIEAADVAADLATQAELDAVIASLAAHAAVDKSAAHPGELEAGDLATQSVTSPKISTNILESRCPAPPGAIGLVVTAGGASYVPVDGAGGVDANAENTVQIQVGRACTVASLYVHLSANAATGGTMALRTNGNDDGGATNLAGAGTGWIRIAPADNEPLGVGDLINVRISPTGGNVTVRGVRLVVEFT